MAVKTVIVRITAQEEQVPVRCRMNTVQELVVRTPSTLGQRRAPVGMKSQSNVEPGVVLVF
jgi:hypothetical protein